MNFKSTLVTAILIFTFSLGFSQSVTKGLIGYWPFNGNANDESINNNHGKVTNATLTLDRFGNKNSAYIFDGNGDYIDCGDSANLFVSTNTTNFWFLFDDTTKIQHFVNCTNSDSGEWGVNYYHHSASSGGGIISGLSGGSNDSWIAAATSRNFRYADSTWHMFTSTYSAKDNSLRFYLDGCFVSNITAQRKGFVNGKDSLSFNNKEHWVYGIRSQYLTSSTGSPGYLDGCLDDIALYNRVLSQVEIKELYNGRVYYDTTNVFDTTYINDTTFYKTYDTTNVFDTTYINDTTFYTTYDTTIVFDTTFVNDTTFYTIYDTTKVTIYDTTNTTIYDTTNIIIYDTTNITIYDTTSIPIYDTTYISINDTTFFRVYDTTRLTIYDTTRITINDTAIHQDTFYLAVTDTLYIKSYLSSGSTNSCVIKMYPNPTNDAITIINGSFCSMLGYTLTIVDDRGKLIYKTAISNKTLSVDLKQFAANGLYYVSLTDAKGKMVSQKKIILY